MEKEMATHSLRSGKFRKQRSLVGGSPWGRRRVRHEWAIEQQKSSKALFSGTFFPEKKSLMAPWTGGQGKRPGLGLSRAAESGRGSWPGCSLRSEWSESHSVMSDSLWPHGLYIVHGILQARILEWEAFPFSRRSSQPKDWTQVSCIADFIPRTMKPMGWGVKKGSGLI